MHNKFGKYIVTGLVVLLVILHQDLWNWNQEEPVLGFMPVALLWQVGISIGAAVTWWIATRIAWPSFEDPLDSETQSQPQQGGES
tara:strand:+ start:228 stop:482 length:255 start_codon:yes stop_codon:yes gene_type:complete